jgi:lipoprotein-releasing system ATP-binding protein
MTFALELHNVSHTYHQGDEDIHVLKEINFGLNPGEVVALVGPSGSGKSTLLQIAGLLETPTSGSVLIDGKDCGSLSDYERTEIRKKVNGFIYQFHYLLPEFTALENVIIPQIIAGVAKKTAKERALHLLERLHLSHRLKHRPAKLSGGEQQRVAIARALANKPKILLGDEPTGNLDPVTAELVFGELMTLAKEQNVAALIATHNMDLAKKMTRSVYLKDGTLI